MPKDPDEKGEPNDGFAKFRWNWIRQVLYDHELSSTAVRIALCLAMEFLNRKSRTAWPSQMTLATLLRCSVKTVENAIASLGERGHLTVTRRGKGVTNSYDFALHDPTKASDQDPKEIADQKDALTGNNWDRDPKEAADMNRQNLRTTHMSARSDEPEAALAGAAERFRPSSNVSGTSEARHGASDSNAAATKSNSQQTPIRVIEEMDSSLAAEFAASFDALHENPPADYACNHDDDFDHVERDEGSDKGEDDAPGVDGLGPDDEGADVGLMFDEDYEDESEIPLELVSGTPKVPQKQC
ncbi:helix-turn-helix domain-containing protein [Mesorhizobium sp. M0589]|uniref:helix-turn-helix domain-containing protein n=1 Tax=Mesorhizobium sp. M0589 TaxID=2956965 RepID=UPI003335C28B